MRKTSAVKLAAAQQFVKRLTEKFPGLQCEIFLESIDGGDVLIRTEIPAGLGDIYEDALDESSRLIGEFDDNPGVYVMTMTIPRYDEEKEPVHG